MGALAGALVLDPGKPSAMEETENVSEDEEEVCVMMH